MDVISTCQNVIHQLSATHPSLSDITIDTLPQHHELYGESCITLIAPWKYHSKRRRCCDIIAKSISIKTHYSDGQPIEPSFICAVLIHELAHCLTPMMQVLKGRKGRTWVDDYHNNTWRETEFSLIYTVETMFRGFENYQSS